MPSRCFDQGCNGCDECVDYDYDDDTECQRCQGDGRDPCNDYLLPCPECSEDPRPALSGGKE